MIFDHFFRDWIHFELTASYRNDPESLEYVSATLIGDHKLFHGQISGLGLTLNISRVKNGSIDSLSFPYHLQTVGAGEKGGKETAKYIIEHVKKTMGKGIGKDWFILSCLSYLNNFKYGFYLR